VETAFFFFKLPDKRIDAQKRPGICRAFLLYSER
jgi:hypothetical protein